MVDKQQLAAMGEHMREMEEMKTVTFDESVWQLVPVDTTDAMYDAGKSAGAGEVCKKWDGNGYEFGSPSPVYAAMLAAAPEYKP